MIRYDTKRNTNQQQHDNMENAGNVGNAGNTGNAGKVHLTNNDEEKYQMVPVPPGLLQYYVKKETILSMKEDIKCRKRGAPTIRRITNSSVTRKKIYCVLFRTRRLG